jgi:hypothetical protein
MPMVYMVFGDSTHKWVEYVEVSSRKTAAEEGRKTAEFFNNTLHAGEEPRTFWCVVPKKPSHSKPKIIKDDIRIATKEEIEDVDKDKESKQETSSTTLCPK